MFGITARRLSFLLLPSKAAAATAVVGGRGGGGLHSAFVVSSSRPSLSLFSSGFTTTTANSNSNDVEAINEELEEVFGQSFQEVANSNSEKNFFSSSTSSISNSTSSVSESGGVLTHVNQKGDCTMVDVGNKRETERSATARATVVLEPRVYELVAQDKMKKGNVLAVAQIAGIQAAKKTSDLIPLCHNLVLNQVSCTFFCLNIVVSHFIATVDSDDAYNMLSSLFLLHHRNHHISVYKFLLCLQVKVDCQLEPETSSIEIVSRAKTTGKTGVEMEALTACTVAALTVYDMCKAASKSTQITNVMLLQKSGGKSGDYNHRKGKTIL